MTVVFRTSGKGGGIKLWDLIEDFDTGCSSSVTIRMEYLFAFQFWYCELCMENRWRREAESTILLIFVFWQYFNCQWMRGRKSYLGPATIASFSSLDFGRSNKHDILTCCIGSIFLRFIFMSQYCFRFYSQQPCR